MLIAEDLLLLLLDDESGASRSTYLSTALGGAVLVELAMAECIEVQPRRWRADRVVVTAGGMRPADPVLVEALATIAQRHRTAQDLVGRLGKELPRLLADRLVEQGVLRHDDSRVLGLFPRHRWPVADPSHEDELRRKLSAALVSGQQPDSRTAALIALLSALDRAHKTIQHEGLKDREVKRRAKEIAEGDWAAAAVRDAIKAAQTAIIAATTASTAAISAS